MKIKDSKILAFLVRNIKRILIGFMIVILLIFLWSYLGKLDAKANMLIKNSQENDAKLSKQITKLIGERDNFLNKLEKLEINISEKLSNIEKLKIDSQKIPQKYEILKKEVDDMSQKEKDKSLEVNFSKWGIKSDVVESGVLMDSANRRLTLNLVLNYSQCVDEQDNYIDQIDRFEDIIGDKDSVILDLKGVIKNDDFIFKRYDERIGEKDVIIKTYKKKIKVLKIKGITTKIIPSIIIGLMIGKFVLK